MIKRDYKIGAIPILLILVIVFVIIDVLVIVGGSAAVGSVAGTFSREGTPAEGGVLQEQELGPIPPSCNGIVEQAARYTEFGIGYSQISHCGPNTIGPEGVTSVDCSGYASRVYRDVGLFEENTCLTTIGIANSSYLQRIAKDEATARQVAEPGDLILFGLGDADGPPQHDHNSHVVIYAGRNQAYESGGREGRIGPHFSPDNVWGGKRQLYGVYRAKYCQSSNP